MENLGHLMICMRFIERSSNRKQKKIFISEMNYQVVFSKHFQKDFDGLELILQQRVVLAVEKLKENPFFRAIKLKDALEGKYRIRVGDYRIRFDVFHNNILLHRVKHRKDVYRF